MFPYLHGHMQMDIIKGQISTFKEVRVNWKGSIHMHTNEYKTGYNQRLNSEARPKCCRSSEEHGIIIDWCC